MKICSCEGLFHTCKVYGSLPLEMVEKRDPLEQFRLFRYSINRDKIAFCCEFLKQQITSHCEQHGYDCPDWLVSIGIGVDNDGDVLNGPHHLMWQGNAGNATYQIRFCPSCGAQLPDLNIFFKKEE